MTLGQNIERFRVSRGLSQEKLGEVVSKSKSTISLWESDRVEPKIGSLEKLAEFFGIQKSELLGDICALPKGAIKPTIAETVMVPLYGSIAAGEPIEMIESDEEYPMFKTIADRYPKAFLLKVKGESMNLVLPNCSYAFVNPTDEIINNKVYALNVNGYDATIKRVRKLHNGFELIPDSTDPTFEPHVYDYGKPDTEEIRIIGRVVYYIIPFDYEI